MFSCSLSTVEPFQCTSTRSIFSTRARLLGNKRSHQVCSCQLILLPLVNTHRLAAWTLNCSSVLVNTYIHARMDHVGVYRKTERQIWWTPLTTTIYITYVQTTAKNLLFLYKYQVTKYQQTKSVVAQRKTTCVSQHSSTWCIDASRRRDLHVNLYGVQELLTFGFCKPFLITRSRGRTDLHIRFRMTVQKANPAYARSNMISDRQSHASHLRLLDRFREHVTVQN